MAIRKNRKKVIADSVAKSYIDNKLEQLKKEIISYIDSRFNEMQVFESHSSQEFGSFKINDLKIISARYGAGDKWADITKELNDAIFEGCICVPSCNFIAGDPAPYKVKLMEVKYELNGEIKEETIKEGELFIIE